MKTSKLKPRRMWVDPNAFGGPYAFTSFNEKGRPKPFSLPVAVIPLDDVDGLIEKAFVAFGRHESSCRYDCRGAMIAALITIGVLPRARKGRK